MVATVGIRNPIKVFAFFMLALAFHCQRARGFVASPFRFASKVARAKVASSKTPIRSTTDTSTGVETLSKDTSFVVDNADGSQSTYFGKRYSMAHKTLPEETMYIFDGTAMLFQAYFAGGGIKNGMNGVALNPKAGKQNGVEGADGMEGAILSPDLNRKIIASMTDDQIRAMIECLNDTNGTASALPTLTGEVTETDRANLQLRCEPLVSVLMQFARFVRDVKPKYVAVAFDAGRTTFRKELYPQYKQQRTQTPAMLVPLFPLTIRVLEAVGCVCLASVGYEADDVMASLGRWAKDRGLSVVHFSQDKDMLQLVDTGVHVMQPRGRELMSADAVQGKYGVAHPAHMRDLQALMGDSVDNIPGVKGIGEKTAAALVRQFHSVSEMYSTLGLTTAPPLPAALAGEAPKSALVKAELEKALTKEGVERAVDLLVPCFDGSKARAATALARLYMCGYENVCLYKQLVTLREDLDLEQIVLHSGSHSETLNRYKPQDDVGSAGSGSGVCEVGGEDGNAVDVIAATADLPMTSVASSAQVKGLVSAMEDVLVDHADKSAPAVRVWPEQDTLTTAHFRYTGERGPHAHTLTAGRDSSGAPRVRSAAEVESLLHEISPALAVPLRLLREQYHKLA